MIPRDFKFLIPPALLAAAAVVIICALSGSTAGEEPPAARRRGADHWAFRAPERPAAPAVGRASWPRNPIDRFILARLEREGLSPSPEAERETLLRRLSLDLIGLPPSIAEIDAFLADASPDAYEQQVERLLASPHYGERWGRHWLDAARYADSDGFEKDKSRSVWFYRDWVVNAFNRDLPYDRFIIEQIAGDQLPGAGQDQIVATGFLRNSMVNEEGGIDPEQFRMEAMFDRMDAIGKGILGLTIQCAQCHDHKFDPLTQEEYYRLFAYLNSDHEANSVVYAPDELKTIEKLRRRMREIEAGLRHRAPDWESRMAEWEERVRREQPDWAVLRPEVEEISTGGQKYLPQPDGSYLALGYAPTKHTVNMEARTELTGITALRIELLADPNLPCGGQGRSFKGTCALTEIAIDAAPAAEPVKKTRIQLSGAAADYEQPERELEPNFFDKSKDRRVTGPAAYAIDGDGKTAWGIDAGPGRRNREREAVFAAAEPFGFPGGTVLTIHLTQNHGGWNSDDHMNNNLGRFRISVAAAAGTPPAKEAAPGGAPPAPLAPGARRILAVPRERRTMAQEEALFRVYMKTVPGWAEANAAIEALWKEWPEGSTQLVLKGREQPRQTRMLKRGDWLKPDRQVEAGVPAFLHPLPDGAPPSRLTFARWLADRRSPTTARVFMNRVWLAYFGEGLVATPEDFGLQSEPPSHPDLLDWLACEFMDGGWSLKHMHRLIAGSAAYRQSSRATPELLERDSRNRLLARGARFRVEGEIVRDIALAASGLLNPRIGGPSVFPPIPYKLVPPVSYGPFNWEEETGSDRYRRALYTFRRRSTPYPVLQAFDTPNADFACVRRARSNTPLQALTTLNEVLFVESARALAARALQEGGATDRERAAYAFRRAAGRAPSAAESAVLLGLLERQRARFAAERERAAVLAGEAAAGADPVPLAAWTVVGRAILNLDETITKD